MSAATTRMSAGEAAQIAARFLALIQDHCERAQLAGSLRRRAQTVGDIEIVAVPRVEVVERQNLFGEVTATGTVDLLDATMTMLLDRGAVERRLRADGKTVWGESMKFLTFEGAPVDLFCPSVDRFGWILLLRTGPEMFSRQLVVERGKRTKDGRPGLLPPHLKPTGGRLTYRVSGQPIATPEEADAFRELGLAYREPWERR